MNGFLHFGRSGRVKLGPWGRGKSVFAAVLAAVCLGIAGTASAQVVPAADAGGMTISAGGTASYYYVGYGERKLLGATAFFDTETHRHIGVEGEARFLEFQQKANVHDETYLIGPRYSFHAMGKFYPYVKGLVGFGEFNFPYNYATGSYLVIAPGGGIDYRLSHRVRLRLADIEYQYWPQFTYGALPSYGVSSGIRVRIF